MEDYSNVCRAFLGSVTVTSNDGVVKPCCIFDQSVNEEWNYNIKDLNSFDYVSKSLVWEDVEDNVNYSKECIQCERIHPNNTKLRMKNLEPKKKLQRLHLALDYTCNLTCRSCRPGISSKWNTLDYSKLLKFDKDHYNDIGILDYGDHMKRVLFNTDLSNLTRVRLAGGEPFLSKHLYWFFELLEKRSKVNNITFSVNTNCTVFPKYLPKFKKINIELSIDGIGDLFEAIRYPAKWNEVLENIKKWKDITNPIIHCTMSVLNINKLKELIDFGNDNNIPVYIFPLHWPAYLRHTQIPLKHREKWTVGHKSIDQRILMPEENVEGFLEANHIMDGWMKEFPNQEIVDICSA